jgi:hypothetical protein
VIDEIEHVSDVLVDGPRKRAPKRCAIPVFPHSSTTLFSSGVHISESPNPGVRTMVQRTLITDIITIYGSYLHTIFPDLFE